MYWHREMIPDHQRWACCESDPALPAAPQEEVLPRVFKDWSISHLCFELDTEPYARSRDATVRQLAAAAGVEVKSPVSHTLYVSAGHGAGNTAGCRRAAAAWCCPISCAVCLLIARLPHPAAKPPPPSSTATVLCWRCKDVPCVA